MLRRCLAVLPLALLVVANTASAQNNDLAVQQQALKIIGDFARDLCGTVATEGNKRQLSLTGDAKAGLTKFIRQLVDIGIEGAAKYESAEYSGVLQQDLAGILTSSQSCRLQVWNDLKNKLLPAFPSASPTPAPLGAGPRSDVTPTPPPVDRKAEACTVVGSRLQHPVTVKVGSQLCSNVDGVRAIVHAITSYSVRYSNPGMGETTCRKSERCSFNWAGAPYFSVDVIDGPDGPRAVLVDAR